MCVAVRVCRSRRVVLRPTRRRAVRIVVAFDERRARMITVAPARADQCPAALALLFAHHPAIQRVQAVRDVLDAQERGEIRLDGLLLAQENGIPVGAALSVMQADNTAFVWPPVADSSVNASRVVDALYHELSRRA